MVVNFISQLNIFVLLISLMIISYIYQTENILGNIYNYLVTRKNINNKLLISIMAGIAGFLPIPGRILSCMTLLDTIGKKQKQFGIISYLSTHHYYMWSPLEKTVLISISMLSLTYIEFMTFMWIPILIYSIYFLFYLIFIFKADPITEMVNADFIYDSRHILSLLVLLSLIMTMIFTGYSIYVMFSIFALFNIILFRPNFINMVKSFNFNLLLIVLLVIFISVLLNSQYDDIKLLINDFAQNNNNILIIGLICFIFSFLFGSSSKFIVFAILPTLIFGIQYFPFFFMLDYAGYLISPMHKCTIYGKMYYDTPFWYYFKYILILAIIMFSYGLIYLYML